MSDLEPGPPGSDDYGDAYDPLAEREQLGVPELLDDLISLVEKAKSMPLSSSAIIARDEVLELLSAAQHAFPLELAQARRVLKDHEELRASVEREAGELLDEARAQAAFMVQRTEVVRQARHQAERIVEEAEAEARRVRHEADDYVDRKLAAFEIVLDRTMRTVHAGRERLSVVPDLEVEPPAPESQPAENGDEPFDQDL